MARLRRRLYALIALVLLLAPLAYYQYDPHAAVVQMSDEELLAVKRVKHVKNLKMSDRIIESSIDAPFQIGCREIDTSGPRANASFVVLARNSELEGVIKSMNSLERHFNQWFNYPWVFLNDQDFDDNFKLTVAKHASGSVEFGKIPKEHWDFPEEVENDELQEYINNQGDRHMLYGNLESYHKMCRFFSNAFFQHELVKKHDWYWRVEPDVEFFCDITYDPFIEMEKHNKKYGFNMMIRELYYTVPSLFRETKFFAKQHGVKPTKLWRLMVKNFKYSKGEKEADFDGIKQIKDILQKIEDDLSIAKFLETKDKKDLSGIDDRLVSLILQNADNPPKLHEDRMDYEEYNLCHFWSNFEIARTDIFTSKLYSKYIRHLEESGGFYKERWGDAPVHSLGLALMLDVSDIHYFRDIGYMHSKIGHCPGNSKLNQHEYSPAPSFANNPYFQLYKPDRGVVNGVGCRCKCPMFHKEAEDLGSSCIKQWHRTTRDDYKPYVPLDLDFYRKKIGRRLNKYVEKGGVLGQSQIAEDLA